MPYYLGEIRLNINRTSHKKRKKKKGLGNHLVTITLIALLILAPFTVFSVVIAAEPSLTSIFNNLGFTNIALTDIETFSAGKYNITLFAEYAGYRDYNTLSYYEFGTSIFTTIFSGPEGVNGPVSGYVDPPLSKIFEVDSQFGLSILTPEHRYFTEHTRNADYPEKHVQIYSNLDDPKMLLIGFENKFGGFDRDYNDMVFSLVPIAPLEIVNVLRSHDIPNYDEPVTVEAQISNRTSNLDTVFLSYKTGSKNWINVTMNLENGSYFAIIPSQPYGSLVSYMVYVSDLLGNSDVSKLYFYTVGDFVSPVISNVHDVSASHKPNEFVEVSANVFEPTIASGVKNVTLWYRTGKDWIPVNMITQNGIWKAIIPGQIEDISVSFFIEAFDVAGNKATTTVYDYNIFSPNYLPIPVLMYSPIITYTGVSVNFDGSASYDPDGSLISYLWDFGDGSKSSLPKLTHSFSENGEYYVTLTIVDNEGAVSKKVAIQIVKNRLPVATLEKYSTIINKKQVVSFDGSGSYDPDGVIVSYLWDFGDGTTGTGSIVNHSYSESGTYTTTLTVTDDDGGTDRIFVTEVINDQPPVAILTASSSTVNIGEVVSFDGSGSYDPDGVIVSYLWDFGDGIAESGVTVSHEYAENGNFFVSLTLTDEAGITGSAHAKIIVVNTPPIASFNVSADTVDTGEVVSFDGSGSYDPDGVIVSYLWDFGDGTTGSGFSVQHVFSKNGKYVIVLTIKDNIGTTDSIGVTMIVRNRLPFSFFTVSPETVDTGDVVSFDGSGSYDPDGVIVSYLWDFGDGTTGSGEITNHAYAEDGVYTVTLTVNDDENANGFSSLSEHVNNRIPVASFTDNATVIEVSEPISFDGSGSYDPDGVIVSYLWDFGDQNSASGISVNHVYRQVGTYVVTLTVEDDDGASSFLVAEKIVTEGSVLTLALLSLIGLGITVLTLTLLYGLLIRRKKKDKNKESI